MIWRILALFLLILPVRAEEMFGYIGIESHRIESIPKWTRVLGRMRADGIYYKCSNGIECDDKVGKWWDVVEKVKGKEKYAQMDEVNDWANNYPYINDIDLWGKSDYWEIPREFINRSGDCEDYAIVKYYTLKSLGWPERSLRLSIVQDTVRDVAHAVLLVELNGKNYILDNLSSSPVEDRYVRQYRPYYAINAQSRWVFVKPLD